MTTTASRTTSNGHRPQDARVPPHSIGAEQSLLGAMLLSGAAIDDAADLLAPDDFYKPAHATVYEAVLALHHAGDPVDGETVADHLHDRGRLDAIGGPGVLVSLMAGTPATSSAARYAKTIAGHALLRRLIGVAGEIAERGYEGLDEPDATLDKAEQLLYALADARRSGRPGVGPRPIDDALAGWLDELEARVDGRAQGGIPTGLNALDHLLGGGLRPGQLVTIAGRPSMGKSAVGAAIAAGVAGHDVAVLVISIEMTEHELMDRWVADAARTDLARIRTGNLGQNDWPHISGGVGRLAGLPIWLDDSPASTITSIRAAARRVARHRPLGAVIVDYMQIVHVPDGAENRQVEVAGVSAALKRLSRDLVAPVVALSQLSRQLEYRREKRPVLADLRESGSIEQDSDVVVGLYRDEVYNPKTGDKGVLEAIVLKQRNGPTGTARLGWLPATTSVVNLAHQEEF